MHDLAWLNSLPVAEAEKELLQCCGSTRWARQMAAARPYPTLEALLASANELWWSLDRNDWLEAFRSHPKIGEKKAAEPVSKQSSQWSGQEQAAVATASQETVDSLATLNRAYEEKFGFIFIICATGKTSNEMLSALRDRLEHEAMDELPIAAAEQSKITALRLNKLLTSG
ncbi:MAG TPA: 2-oxo-4-hydroxy-4-carboxy-5-ureidoimidazoline decarboxylase [Pyrinomonadaceae bacterium]|nr:2-oxo-4-hydroxy-4-carboxy-5-ureidoimidazoline decarboxylase [Pyrinomonadaceae bacterium]